jgi:hypothetical protein
MMCGVGGIYMSCGVLQKLLEFVGALLALSGHS